MSNKTESRHRVADPMTRCELCGEPMPEGEEMFRYHGYSVPCPNKQLGSLSVAETQKAYLVLMIPVTVGNVQTDPLGRRAMAAPIGSGNPATPEHSATTNRSAAQKSNASCCLSVAQAREAVERAADKLLSMHEVTQAQGWTEFISALDVHAEAIRAEGQQYLNALEIAVNKRASEIDELKARIAALTTELNEWKDAALYWMRTEAESNRRAESAERDRDRLLSAREPKA